MFRPRVPFNFCHFSASTNQSILSVDLHHSNILRYACNVTKFSIDKSRSENCSTVACLSTKLLQNHLFIIIIVQFTFCSSHVSKREKKIVKKRFFFLFILLTQFARIKADAYTWSKIAMKSSTNCFNNFYINVFWILIFNFYPHTNFFFTCIRNYCQVIHWSSVPMKWTEWRKKTSLNVLTEKRK